MIGRLFGARAKRPPYLAIVEYWIYLTEPKMAPQEVLLARLIRNSPFQQEGEAPLGTGHGLLFSDIRLQNALVLRERNAHLFRPDLFEAHIEPSPSAIAALSNAKALVRSRYHSSDPLKDRRYLRLMPFLAEAIAYYGKSEAIFDFSAERLFETAQLREALQKPGDAESAEMHLRTVWIPEEEGGRAATRGLAKIGLPELVTPPSPNEQRTVVCGVLEEAAGHIWDTGEIPDEISAEYMSGSFLVRVDPGKKGPLSAHVMRVGP